MERPIPETPAAQQKAWLGAFAHRDFAIVWLASALALVGISMYDTASGWLMTTLALDPLDVSLVHAATNLPMFLFTLGRDRSIQSRNCCARCPPSSTGKADLRRMGHRCPRLHAFALQKFIGGGSGAVSITGFVDRSGDLFVTRRGAKVFQRLRDTGVGVCFESLPADPELSEAVRRLCRDLVTSAFEVEFIWSDGRWALIDFNPRLFNQVGMDIRRAMPLPLFACLDALGEAEALREAVERAKAYDERLPAVIYDKFTLNAILLAQRLRGGLSLKRRQ